MNGDALSAGELRDLGELPIGAKHEDPLERPSTGAQRFPDRMQAVDDVGGFTASSEWCRPVGLPG